MPTHAHTNGDWCWKRSTMQSLLDELRQRTLLGDGAMGTQLMLAGLVQGNCGEEWNLTHPERVLAIQRRYVDAGSDCLLTNTFGGSRIMLNRHGNADLVAEINRAGVAMAGDAGADAIIIETQTSLEELGLGIEAAKAAGAACVIGSMAYDVTLDGSTFRTMMGIDPERAAEFMEENGADIVALNCGTGMDMERARQAVARYRQVTDLPVMAQPNAGQPKLIEMKVVYDESPQHMVAGVVPLIEAGANIVGSCCGSTPDHIRAFRKAIDEYMKVKA